MNTNTQFGTTLQVSLSASSHLTLEEEITPALRAHFYGLTTPTQEVERSFGKGKYSESRGPVTIRYSRGIDAFYVYTDLSDMVTYVDVLVHRCPWYKKFGLFL